MFNFTEGCTVSFSLSSAQGRGRPGWPRQTRSWAPSGSGQSTRDTLLLPHLWPSPTPVTGINVKMIVSAHGMWSVVGCCLMKMRTNLRVSDGSKSLLFQLINRLFVLPEVKLCTNQNNRNLRTMMPNLTNDSSINAQIQRAYWSPTSGYHLALTFSKLAGFTREKQIRNTSWNMYFVTNIFELLDYESAPPSVDRRGVSVCRNPPVRPCPTDPSW